MFKKNTPAGSSLGGGHGFFTESGRPVYSGQVTSFGGLQSAGASSETVCGPL